MQTNNTESLRQEILARTSGYDHASNALREKLPALDGHTYLFRKLAMGWVSVGMVDDDKREFFARYYTGECADTGGKRCDLRERGSAIAFMPYSVTNTNFVTQEMVDNDAVEYWAFGLAGSLVKAV